MQLFVALCQLHSDCGDDLVGRSIFLLPYLLFVKTPYYIRSPAFLATRVGPVEMHEVEIVGGHWALSLVNFIGF